MTLRYLLATTRPLVRFPSHRFSRVEVSHPRDQPPFGRVTREFAALCQHGLLLSLRSLTLTHQIGRVWGVMTSSYQRGHTDTVNWLATEGRSHVYLADVRYVYLEAESLDDRVTMSVLRRGWRELEQ